MSELVKESPDGAILVSTQALIRIFDITKQTINKWTKNGCPRYSRGWYDLHEVIVWRGIGRTGDRDATDSPAAKKLKADADIKYAKARQEELKLAEIMGELIPKELVEARLSDTFAGIRQRLLAVPNEVRMETYTTHPEVSSEVTKIADTAVRECLHELAEFGNSGDTGSVGKKPSRRGRPRKKKV